MHLVDQLNVCTGELRAGNVIDRVVVVRAKVDDSDVRCWVCSKVPIGNICG